MSNRFYEFDKGSSRSARDDSRHKGRDYEREEKDKRVRSRSPRRYTPPTSSRNRHSSEKSTSRDRDYEERRRRKKSANSDPVSDEEVPAPPPPPRISKISIGFSKPKAPIKMNIGGAKAEKVIPKPTVASVFNTDDDDEPEEMPAEAKMRMRNIGRETPTSAGPNSFGKTKQGFCDAKKVFEKNLKQALETEQRPVLPKFPQTIYKIKPS